MEDNLLCPSQDCNLMELLPILMDIPTNEEIILSPSQANQELQMSTEERLIKLSKPTRKYRIYTDVNTFGRTPDIIVFQNFEPGVEYKTTISFLNLHPVSRHIRVVTRNSPTFKVYGPTKDCSAKLAPGMSYMLNVTFLPLENKNYIHYITIITDTETFNVPIYGLCCTALLNLPDYIKLPSTALNIVSEKKLILHNFGKKPASFVISSKAPFSVSPSRKVINEGQFIDLKVTCKASTLGLIKNCICIGYNTINIMIPIECEVYNINVYLDKNTIKFDDIYMGLKRQSTVTVYNNSNHYVDFKWNLHKSAAHDKLENSKMIKNLENMKELEKMRCSKLEHMDVIDYEGHSNVYEKIFENEVAELETDNSYLYRNNVFDIIPLVGQILPNKTLTFTASFTPTKNEHYESVAYLDVKGSDRLPLKMSGAGMGPYVSLNVKVLNINDVFLCATHNYEIAVKNEGLIPATVVYKDCVTDFNSTITCAPKKVHLPIQDSCDAFIISFYSEVKGKFIETVQFVIKESGEILQFVMTGNVVCPLLTMDIQGVDFGAFPFGNQQMKQFLLINACQVPIDYKIVLENNSESYSEIHFEPDHGIVSAYSDQPICIYLESRGSKEVDINFKVVMWGSDQYSISSFLKYCCICPDIKCYPSDVTIKFCFLNFDYKRTIMLKNNAAVSGVITYTPQQLEDTEGNNIVCILNKTEFDMQGHESQEIELSILTNVLGKSELPLIFTVAGSQPQELCRITVDGQGPVVSCKPEEVQFNEIRLLQTKTEALTLVNDSPIPAVVEVSLGPKAFFEVDISKLEIMPDEQKVIVLSTYLTDTGRYNSVLNISIQNGETIEIKVSGEGVGHSIFFEPILDTEYDAKTLLTHQPFVLPVKMTNLGKKFYKLRWTPFSMIKHLKDKLAEPEPGYTFHIKEQYFELANLQSKTFEIEGRGKDQKQIEEEFFCYASLDQSNKMVLVASFKIKAKIVEPSLTIVKPVLDILVVKEDCQSLEDNLFVVNELNVPTFLNISANSDYYIVQGDDLQSSVIQGIQPHETIAVKIKFKPVIREKRYFKKSGELTIGYTNHPYSVKCPLSTEVCFPTVSLSESKVKFPCVPLNSYSYKKIIIQNVTFLPAKFSWEILAEFFEIEQLPKNPYETNDTDVIKKREIKSKQKLTRGDISTEESNPCILLWDKLDYSREMKNILFPTIQKFTDDSNELDLFDDTNEISETEENKISNILTIEPFRGYLEPYEYGVITVGFFPPPNTSIRAKIVCNVEDGEYETLSITGISCKIAYVLDKKVVELGCKLFCEICESAVLLTNKGFCVFSYSVTCDDVRSDSPLEAGWLNVTPKSVTLNPGDSVSLKIKYFPGVVGEFNGAFKLAVGYLESFDIKIHGYGVCSQVYLYIPRPIINEQPTTVMYNAISSVTYRYLRTLEDMNSPATHSQLKSVRDNNLTTESFPSQLHDEWVVITKKQIYPSEMDIDLAIERALLSQYITEHPYALQEHTYFRKTKTIPYFVIPAYTLNFGYVVVDKPVCYTVLLYNYGPTMTEVRLVKDSVALEKKKFKIEYTPKKMDVGDVLPLYVVFHPTLRRYPGQDVQVTEQFSLVVSHGGSIPILINAVVTLPRFSFEDKLINFETVNIGCCKRKSVIVKNDGYVLTKWTAQFKKKDAYFIQPSKGTLGPGKKDMVDIYFMPTVKDYITGKLCVYLEGSPKTITIDMCGYGVGPNLAFNQGELKFTSALPYTNDSTIVLEIQNMSTSPEEFCFADFDQDYDKEKLLINTFFNAHTVKHVLMPLRQAGQPLHSIFEENYIMCLDELRKKIAKVDNKEIDNLQTENLPDENPLAKYPPEQIVKMLNEYLESNQIIEESGSTDVKNTNELFANMTILEPENEAESKKLQSGLFIIFHGASKTDYLKAALKASTRLEIPLISIDRLIYDALVENNTQSANKINILIDEHHKYVADDQNVDHEEEDQYDILMRKVTDLNQNKKQKTQKKSSKLKEDNKSNKTSEKVSAKVHPKKEKETPTVVDIPIELFEDVLKHKLKLAAFDGLIIESLHSEFLRTVNIALTTVLTAIGNSKYVHVILLSYTLYDYLKSAEERETYGADSVGLRNVLSQTQRVQKSSKTIESESVLKSAKRRKKSKSEKSAKNNTKSMMKLLSQTDKSNFEAFQQLINECYEISQFWDKKNGVLLKPHKTKHKSSDTDLKDSVKDLKLPQQKKSVYIQDDITEDLGIFLWIIDNASNERRIDFCEIICDALEANSELQEAKKEISEHLEEKHEESSTLFTIINKPNETVSGSSDYFVIGNYNNVKETKSLTHSTPSKKNLPSLLKLKSGVNKKRSLGKRFISIDEKFLPAIGAKGSAVTYVELITRRILQPGESVYYEFKFCPKKCGVYKHSFSIQMTGLNTMYVLNCSGVCELPRIDLNPYTLFPNVLECYRDKAINTNFVYIKEMNVLDFGLVFVDSEKPYVYHCNLLLKNISQLTCEVKTSLSKLGAFSLDTDSITIEPAQEVLLPISVKPVKAGLLKTTLCISVKNNPVSKVFNIVTKACKLDFSIKPKLLFFDKVPVNQVVKKKLTFSNQSPINVFWKFIDFHWAQQIYNISKTEGFLGPFSIFVIVISYAPVNEENHHKKQFGFQIFDPHYSNTKPVYIDYITLHAESIEYRVEYNEYIDLGEIKGKVEHKVPFTLLNKGLTSICMSFEKINAIDKNKYIRSLFHFKMNTTETLLPNKLFTGLLIFKPVKAMEFQNVPVFICNFVECAHLDNVMSSFVVKISAKIVLSKFEVSPATNLNFGYQQNYSSKKNILQLKNTGKFPFSYTIAGINEKPDMESKVMEKKKARESKISKTDRASKRSVSRKSVSKKSDGKKSKNKDDKRKKLQTVQLHLDCFCIEPSFGEISPNETINIEVVCCPTENKEYKELVIIYVSEPSDEDAKGRPIILNAMSCEPLLNFYDFRKIFKEQFIIDKLENLNFPKNVGSHCVYESSEVTLHFRRVCLSSHMVSKIYMQNTGHVTARVTTQIEDGNRNIFKVTPSSVDINPFSMKSMSIVFTPECVGECQGKLEISWNSSVNNKFSLALIGDALLPNLKVIEPKIDENNQKFINFPPTYIGQTRTRKISIKNIGHIPGKAIIDIFDNSKDMFIIKAHEDTYELLNVPNMENFQTTKSSTLVNLEPDQTANFDLIFKPDQEDHLQSFIKIHTVNNPFEFARIGVMAQSFYHNIYLEGLVPYVPKQSNVIGYKFNFGYSAVNILQKKCFSIVNNSECFIYKFEFGSIGPLTFTPRIGHLKPFSRKDIIATFFSMTPRHFEKEHIECRLEKISYSKDPDPEAPSWDERQKFATWGLSDLLLADTFTKASFSEKASSILDEASANLQKDAKTEHQPEPEFTVIPKSSEVISCFFSIMVDYSSYINQVEEIDFPDTYINESSETQFKIENNGYIPLQIEWKFLTSLLMPVKSTSEEHLNTAISTYKNEPRRSSSATTLCSIDPKHPVYDYKGMPFTIVPKKTSILPKESKKFLIKFSPTNLSQYCVNLQSDIICLKPKLENIRIKLNGKGLRPTYYFEIKESNYMNNRPNGVQKCGTHDLEHANIIEFESIGIGVLSVEKFNLVNPGTEPFDFTFKSLEEYPPFSYFDCKTPNGYVNGGKKFEVIFTFKSHEFGCFEGYYIFEILGKHMSVPFLLAGRCRQPSIYFTKSHIAIKPTILTVPASTTAVLKNNENIEIFFEFRKESLLSENQDQSLEVLPRKDKLSPNSEQTIKFTFKGEKTGDHNFYIQCIVEKLPNPLCINISAQCVEIQPLITYSDKFESVVVTLDTDKENCINFGTLIPKRTELLKFDISNIGVTGFFYTVQFNSKPIEHLFSFSLNQEKDFVPSNKHADLIMYLEPFRKATLKDFKVKINISYGPTYELNINAVAEAPLVHFSFFTYNFGHCIVQKRKSNYYNVSLEVKNVGTRVLLLENCYENSDNLTVDFTCAQIRPSCTRHIIIYFHPLEVGHLVIKVLFKVNSVKYMVKITGEAVKINLQLVNSNDKYIDLGGVMVGSQKQYVVEVINKSPTHLNAFFDLKQKLPFYSRPLDKIESEIKVPDVAVPIKKIFSLSKSKDDSKGDKITPKKGIITSQASVSEKINHKEKKKSKKDKAKSEKNKADKVKKIVPSKTIQEEIETFREPLKKTAQDFLKITPANSVYLGPDKKHTFVIDFRPTEKLDHFSEQIFYEIQGHVEPLCVVKGYSIAPKFALSEEHLTFSNVVLGLKHRVSILLRNIGDLGGRFHWVFERGVDMFHIVPLSGFIGPSSEMEISITFLPKIADAVYKAIAKCIIDSMDKNLELILEGNSTKIPAPLAIFEFSCPVREITGHYVKIANQTKDNWKIHPIVSNSQFSVPREIIVEAESEYTLDITYSPEYMTIMTSHNATLFLPLPEGKAIIYKLIGQALPPLPINIITLDIPCKKNHVEVLLIRNWLNAKQCFSVKTELTTPVTALSLYKASGNSLLELLPNETKDYHWNIYVINEIPLDFKVTFTNLETKEYMYYEINLNVLPRGPIETINISTCVRKQVDVPIILENPIDQPVTFNIDCDIPDSTFDRIVLVEPCSTYQLTLQYCPLKSEQITTQLHATCPQLGTYIYSMNVIAHPPFAENTVKFRAELGDKVYKSVLWKNTFHASVEFTAKFDHHIFGAEKPHIIMEGEKGRIKFSFEPTELGFVQSKGIIYSPVTGSYIYPLVGECVLPTPKGPFSVKPGGSTLINFLNPFLEDQLFAFEIESDAFYLKGTSETIKGKKSTKIAVHMHALKHLELPVETSQITGKLIVKAIDGPIENIKWIFYIQSDN